MARDGTCDTEDGESSTMDDCNDGDDSIYPGALEYCDGVDRDCDTVFNNGTIIPPDYTVMDTWPIGGFGEFPNTGAFVSWEDSQSIGYGAYFNGLGNTVSVSTLADIWVEAAAGPDYPPTDSIDAIDLWAHDIYNTTDRDAVWVFAGTNYYYLLWGPDWRASGCAA